MKHAKNLEILCGGQESPVSFLVAHRKWNPTRIDAVPMKISDHEYKRNVEEMGRFLYKHIESQVQRQSEEVPSSETESIGSKDPEKDKAA